ncbi:hypothetical protein BRARA_B01647 [Brassica rapa]|uniref:Uncharacterized protein n=1 Tax=Brassica campestris TaxID=3711 RepID=A0A398AD24_BRACM|nr:hypothetical protein BRARA_B01647 [Brassica rapa]
MAIEENKLKYSTTLEVNQPTHTKEAMSAYYDDVKIGHVFNKPNKILKLLIVCNDTCGHVSVLINSSGR